MPDPTTFETRTVAASFEIRSESTNDELVVEGYAATFNQPYDMGPFWEQVGDRAFDRTLAGSPDVRFLVDHEGQPLARTKSGTLTLATDSTGLIPRARMDRRDPDVQRLEYKMRRGDLDQMSFAFRVPSGGDSWDYSGERTMRTLQELNLSGGDVSVVTYPANPSTSVSVRARDLLEARCVFVEQMAREMRSGNALSPESVAKLQQVLAELTPVEAPAEEIAPVVEETPQRGMTPDTAKRLLAAADAAIRAA